jgi:salicylate hydroxylase
VSPQPPRVLIAGAGIAGLVAGLALLQRGIEVDIFE